MRTETWIAAAAACVLALATGCDGGGEPSPPPPVSVDEAEPLDAAPGARTNDTAASAETLRVGIPLFGSLADGADVDWYAFTARAGQLVTVDTFATRLDQASWNGSLRVRLVAQDGTTELYRMGEESTFAPVDHGIALVRLPADGRYLVALAADVPALPVGAYALRVDVADPPAGLRLEAEPFGQGGATGTNQTRATAEPLQPGLLYGYYGGAADEHDWYAIAVTAPVRIRLQLTAQRNGVYAAGADRYDPEVALYDGAGDLAAPPPGPPLWRDDDTISFDSSVDYVLVVPGTYYLDVSRCCFVGAAPYFLSYAASPYDPLAEGVGNLTPAAASPVAYGATVAGSFNAPDQDHWFSFTAAAGDLVRVTVLDQTHLQVAGLAVSGARIFRDDGATELPSDFFADRLDGFNGHAVLQAIVPAAGTYRVALSNGNALGDFALAVERVVAAGWEAEPNGVAPAPGATPQANRIAASGWIAGAIGAPGDADVFVLAAGAGELVTVSLHGDAGLNDAEPAFSQWGSLLTPTLEVRDREGTVLSATAYDVFASGLGFAESLLRPGPMLQVAFRAPAAGDYWVTVGDALGGGGEAYPYALEVNRGR